MIKDYWGNNYFGGFSAKGSKQFDGARVLFSVGSLSISGGTNLILYYAHKLASSGAEVTIGYLLEAPSPSSWHPKGHATESKPLDKLRGQHFDLVIFTWWPTVYETRGISAGQYLYFVQSLESRFALNYKDKPSEIRAAGTYTFGAPVVTVASWLQNLLASQTGSPTWLVRNGVDKKVFPIERSDSSTSDRLRVLVEGALGVPMKAVDETIDAIAEVDGITLSHLSPEHKGGSLMASNVYERLNLREVADVYRKNDLLVKMSRVEGMFGPPLESFHLGLTGIFSKVTGHDEYLVDGFNSILVDVDDFETVTLALSDLVKNRELLRHLQDGACQTANSWPSIEESAQQFAAICHSLIRGVSFVTRVETGRDEFEEEFRRRVSKGLGLEQMIPPGLLH